MKAAVTERQMSRRRAREFAAMPPDERATLERIVRRWSEQDDLRLFEWAMEYGVEYWKLFRVARHLGVSDQWANSPLARRAQP